MKFEWDDNKNRSNFAAHGYDFTQSSDLLSSDHLLWRAKDGKTGEKRWMAIGIIEGRYATLIFTMRGEAIRVISIRRARNDEKKHYQNVFD